MCRVIEEQYNKHDYLLEGNLLNDKEKAYYGEVRAEMSDSTAAASLRSLSDFLSRYYGKKVIVLLDEYVCKSILLYDCKAQEQHRISSLQSPVFLPLPYGFSEGAFRHGEDSRDWQSGF